MTVTASAAEVAAHLRIHTLAAGSVDKRANITGNPPPLTRVARLESADPQIGAYSARETLPNADWQAQWTRSRQTRML
jgi:hypothetical protein